MLAVTTADCPGAILNGVKTSRTGPNTGGPRTVSGYAVAACPTRWTVSCTRPSPPTTVPASPASVRSHQTRRTHPVPPTLVINVGN